MQGLELRPCPKTSVGSESKPNEIINEEQHHRFIDVQPINGIKLLIMLWITCLVSSVFIDVYYVSKNVEYMKDYIKATLAVSGVHFMIQNLLENMIHSIKPEDMILYSTTRYIRDIINNVSMTLIYVFDDYRYWFIPMIFGCYITDLVTMLSKWCYVKSSSLRMVFVHHSCAVIMFLLLSHFMKIITDILLLGIIIFVNSNTAGCSSPVWKAFKLPLYEWSSIICFLLQRVLRFTSYFLVGLGMKTNQFFQTDYCYIVPLVFGLLLDIVDIYGQTQSIYKYYKKKHMQK
eukprot:201334_1